jgi:hypothetical protein
MRHGRLQANVMAMGTGLDTRLHAGDGVVHGMFRDEVRGHSLWVAQPSRG